MDELYKRYRPDAYSDMIGQEEAVRALKQYNKKKNYPHAIAIIGPSGCGKTTLARIIANKLKALPDVDYCEINAANVRGIDDIRKIEREYNLHPMGGTSRVYCIDEAHQVTKDGQSAMLKMLEDTPKHTYFILCTTEPSKLLKAIMTRCDKIKVNPLTVDQLVTLVKDVVKKEKKKIKDSVATKIAEASDGSARTALVILNQIIDLKNSAEQIASIYTSDMQKQAFDLVKVLLYTPKRWPAVAAVIKELNEDPEGLRRLILAIATTEMLKAGRFCGRAKMIIDSFRDNYFDCGKAGLIASAYEVAESSKY